jgi:hypothetical protein
VAAIQIAIVTSVTKITEMPLNNQPVEQAIKQNIETNIRASPKETKKVDAILTEDCLPECMVYILLDYIDVSNLFHIAVHCKLESLKRCPLWLIGGI